MMGIRFVKFLTRRFANAPEGTAVLFFIQIFATLGFAVLYSTLVLYATKHLQLSVKVATTFRLRQDFHLRSSYDVTRRRDRCIGKSSFHSLETITFAR